MWILLSSLIYIHNELTNYAHVSIKSVNITWIVTLTPINYRWFLNKKLPSNFNIVSTVAMPLCVKRAWKVALILWLNNEAYYSQGFLKFGGTYIELEVGIVGFCGNILRVTRREAHSLALHWTTSITVSLRVKTTTNMENLKAITKEMILEKLIRSLPPAKEVVGRSCFRSCLSVMLFRGGSRGPMWLLSMMYRLHYRGTNPCT